MGKPKETTHEYPLKYRRRFQYFETTCKGEAKGTWFNRTTRKWWRPFEKLGNFLLKMVYKIPSYRTGFWDRVVWFIRRNLTYT